MWRWCDRILHCLSPRRAILSPVVSCACACTFVALTISSSSSNNQPFNATKKRPHGRRLLRSLRPTPPPESVLPWLTGTEFRGMRGEGTGDGVRLLNVVSRLIEMKVRGERGEGTDDGTMPPMSVVSWLIGKLMSCEGAGGART